MSRLSLKRVRGPTVELPREFQLYSRTGYNWKNLGNVYKNDTRTRVIVEDGGGNGHGSGPSNRRRTSMNQGANRDVGYPRQIKWKNGGCGRGLKGGEEGDTYRCHNDL